MDSTHCHLMIMLGRVYSTCTLYSHSGLLLLCKTGNLWLEVQESQLSLPEGNHQWLKIGENFWPGVPHSGGVW